MEQMMMCIPRIYNYYLYDLKNIDNKKIEKNDETDNDMYILHVNRYAIRTCSGLGR
jgi:hypothetical protein